MPNIGKHDLNLFCAYTTNNVNAYMAAASQQLYACAVYLRIVVPMYRQGETVSVGPNIWLGTVVFAAAAATFVIGLAAQIFLV